ncbi:DUF6203 family protein [Spongiactinospora sp. 9N601]|uniref:DUF6203 family protein n=1 Tax=Spongiactinospora sp. 9N601 TaxID=3375149 RepID=UPI0037BCCAEF
MVNFLKLLLARRMIRTPLGLAVLAAGCSAVAAGSAAGSRPILPVGRRTPRNTPPSSGRQARADTRPYAPLTSIPLKY